MNYKILLDKRRQLLDGRYPLKLRIYDGLGSTAKSLKIYLHEHEWDEQAQTVLKTCKNHKAYNCKLLHEKTEITKVILFGAEIKKPVKHTVKHSIIEYGKKLSQDFNSTGKTGNAIVYNTAVEMLIRYTCKKRLLFEDIDYTFLKNFENDLLQRQVKVNTISIYLRTIRAIFNKAINEELTENYPFKKFKIKQQPTPSRSLTIDEFKQIKNYKCSGDREFNRDLFLLSFYLIGINFTDLFLLRQRNIINGRIVFERSKTHKIYSVLLHEPALEILAKYKSSSDFLLPVLSNNWKGMQQKNKTQQAIHICNNYLQKISKELNFTKKVSTYYARYSWANFARLKGFSKDLIAEALGHEYGNRVTGIYLDSYGNEIIDEANKAVIQFVLRNTSSEDANIL